MGGRPCIFLGRAAQTSVSSHTGTRGKCRKQPPLILYCKALGWRAGPFVVRLLYHTDFVFLWWFLL